MRRKRKKKTQLEEQIRRKKTKTKTENDEKETDADRAPMSPGCTNIAEKFSGKAAGVCTVGESQ